MAGANKAINVKNKVINLIVILVALFIAWKIYLNQEDLKKNLEEKKVMETKKNELLGNIQQNEERIAVLKKTINTKDRDLIMNSISQTAKDNSVNINSFKESEQQSEHSLYKEYVYNLSITSNSYHNIGKFISDLENSPNIYIVKTISMQSREKSFGGSKETGSILNAELNISTIFLKENF